MGFVKDLPIYQEVADRMERMVGAGIFTPGSRLPSVRELSRTLSVSITTALGAYRVLEQKRLIVPRERSGYYVRSLPRGRPEPLITATAPRAQHFDFVRHVLREYEPQPGGDFVSLDTAISDPHFLPTDRFNQLLIRALRERPLESQSYDSTAGLPELRTQLARRMFDAGCDVSPADIITTAGATQAVYLCLAALTRPDDTVVVETPTFFGFLAILDALRLQVLEVATCPRDGICLEALDDVLRSQRVAACLLVPNFGNPSGHCMPSAKKEQLVHLLAEHGVPLVEDDIYGELSFTGERPGSAKAFDRTGNVLYCSSFSKTMAPGYRIGWTVPGRFAERIQRLKFSMCVASPTCTQMAMAAFLETGAFDRHVRRARQAYGDMVARMSRVVSETFPETTRVTRPTGGHLLWVELPAGIDAFVLRERAWKAGVGIAPGPAFSPTGRYTNFIRLNCAVPWSAMLESALRTLARLVHGYADG